MTEETKIRLFEVALNLEHLGNENTYDGHDYASQAIGAFKMLMAIGLDTEYIKWANGK